MDATAQVDMLAKQLNSDNLYSVLTYMSFLISEQKKSSTDESQADTETFDAIMKRGLEEARAGKGVPASEVIAELREGL